MNPLSKTTLKNLSECLNEKLLNGPDFWDCSGEDFSLIKITLDGEDTTAGEICKLAVESKRNRDYDTAANAYILLLDTITAPSISIATSLFKFLCTINEYVLAFQLISCVCADVQVEDYVHPSYKIQLEKMYNTFIYVVNLTHNIGNISELIDFTKGYSGQNVYIPIIHEDFILKQISTIITKLERDFGKDNTCRYIRFN